MAVLLAVLLVSACLPDEKSAEKVVAATGATPLPTGKAEEGPSLYGSYLAARFAQSRGDLGPAAEMMDRVLRAHPGDPRLLRSTYILMLGAGRLDRAVELARQLEKTDTDVPTVALLLAGRDVKAGKFREARARLEAMPGSGLSRFAIPLSIAWTYVGDGDYDAALKALAPLDAEKGFSTLSLLHSGLINDIAGRDSAAEEDFRAISEKLAEAPLRVVRAAGSFFERNGRVDEARALYQAYLADNPNSFLLDQELVRLKTGKPPEPLAATASEGMAEGLFNLASALPRDRAGNVALLYARIATDLHPDFALAQLLIGDILAGHQRLQPAIEAYRRVPSDTVYGWAARLRIADALYEKGDMQGATTLLEVMAEERPERPDALFKLGNLLRYKEHFAQAVKAYDRAFARLDDPDDADWSMFYYRGIALERSKQWARAEENLLKALELKPDQPYVLNYLGYSWVEQGKNIERARKMIERAVDLRRNDGYIVDSMGWVLYRLGDYEKAVENLERAVQLRPQDPVINDHLGDAYWKVGRHHEARFQWRRALSLKPEKDTIGRIEAKIERGLVEATVGKSGG